MFFEKLFHWFWFNFKIYYALNFFKFIFDSLIFTLRSFSIQNPPSWSYKSMLLEFLWWQMSMTQRLSHITCVTHYLMDTTSFQSHHHSFPSISQLLFFFFKDFSNRFTCLFYHLRCYFWWGLCRVCQRFLKCNRGQFIIFAMFILRSKIKERYAQGQ